MSLKLSIHGNPSGYSGPAIHCQELTRCLLKQDIDITLSSNTPIKKDTVPLDLWGALEAKGDERSVTLTLENPMLWWKHMADRRKALIGYLVFEGDCIGYEWAQACVQEEIDEIWCPSKHVYDAIKHGCLTFCYNDISDKIKIIPHGYDSKLFSSTGKKLDIYDKDIFTFIYVGGWSQGLIDRKGLDIAYTAFCNEFKNNENVRFIFKVTTIYNQPGYDPQNILKSIAVKHKPKVLAIVKDVQRQNLAELYRTGDVCLYPTKAEGFGLTALESMACGTPVITAGYGGQMDFINEKNGWIIDKGKMADATDPTHFYDFAKWYTTDWRDWAKQMRYCFDNRADVEKKRKKALKDVKQFTWEHTAIKAKAELEKFI